MVVGWDFYRCLCWHRGSLLDIQLDFPKTLSTPIRHLVRYIDGIDQPRFLVLADLRFHCVTRFGHSADPRSDQFDVPEFNP